MTSFAKQSIICGVLVLVCFLIWNWQGTSIPQYDSRPREEVLDIFARLSLGDSPMVVRATFNEQKYKYLKLIERTNVWYIQTPFEPGAVNWELIIEFESKAISAVRIRLADSIKMKPLKTPPDKQM